MMPPFMCLHTRCLRGARACGGPPQGAPARPSPSPRPGAADPPPAMTRVPVAGSNVGHPAALGCALRRRGAPPAFRRPSCLPVDVEEFAHDPELEEASIRFANGDDKGAEAGLLEVLGPKGSRVGHDETWLTLFDLYRATGQQDRFESAAIEFAGRFGRSAPQWFSIPKRWAAWARRPAPLRRGSHVAAAGR
jgi:hypothetical protein